MAEGGDAAAGLHGVLGGAEAVAEQVGGGVEVGDGDGQPEEPGRAVGRPSALVLRADQLDDHLAGAEERLAHRRAVGRRCPAPAAPRSPTASSAAVVRSPSGVTQHDVVDAACAPFGWTAAGSAGAASPARVGMPSTAPSASGPAVRSRSDQSRMRLPRSRPDQPHPHRADAAGAVVVDREAGGRPGLGRVAHHDLVDRRLHGRCVGHVDALGISRRRCGPGAGGRPCRSERRLGTRARSRAPGGWSGGPCAASSALRSSTACTPAARISTSATDPASSSSPASMRAASVGVVAQHAVDPQDVGDEVVGERGQAVEVVEPPGPGAVERPAQVGRGELSPLVERHLDAVPGATSWK